jgi:hypothetical protein
VIPQTTGGGFALGVGYDATIGYWPLAEGLDITDVTGDGRRDVVVAIGGNQPGSMINVFAQRKDGVLDTVRDNAPADFSSGIAADVPPAIRFARPLDPSSVSSNTFR